MADIGTGPIMRVAGVGICIPDDAFASELGYTDCGLKLTVLPPMARRRTSLATRMAISAAESACAQADSGHDLPAIFVSSLGEIQTTDKLCNSIARKEYPLSPTLFHNSVHNTAAGYWSISVGTLQPMQAMAALADGFALGLLEAACQLQTITDQVLLVCYDEQPPEQLLPDYHWCPLALALVLQSHRGASGVSLSLPFQELEQHEFGGGEGFSRQNPAMAGLPLFDALSQPDAWQNMVRLSDGQSAWYTKLYRS